MPLIQIDMFEGRTDKQVRVYCQALTDATCRVLGCGPADVSIILRDVPRSRWSTGGRLWSDASGDVLQDAVAEHREARRTPR